MSRLSSAAAKFPGQNLRRATLRKPVVVALAVCAFLLCFVTFHQANTSTSAASGEATMHYMFADVWQNTEAHLVDLSMLWAFRTLLLTGTVTVAMSMCGSLSCATIAQGPPAAPTA